MSGIEQIKADVFQWKSSTLFYRTWGKGKKVMIAFHGYGLDGQTMYPITESILDQYTIIAIDLPYQGRSRWRETSTLTGTELKLLIQQFLLHIHHQGKVSLLAYSIGGNYALGLVHHCPEIVDKLVLIAADGLKFKLPFWIITRTWIGKALFNGFVLFPQPVFFTIKLGRKINLFPPRVLNFFYESIATKNKRAALRMRWISVSRIMPWQANVIATLNQNKIKVLLIFGRKDHVIPVKNAVRFGKKIDNCHLEILEQGHQLLHKGNAKLLQRLLEG